MKKIILAFSFALAACGAGSSSNPSENQKGIDNLPGCSFSGTDFSKITGRFASLNEASHSLMNWTASIALTNNCKVNAQTLAQSLGENINLSTDATGQVDVTLIKGDQK